MSPNNDPIRDLAPLVEEIERAARERPEVCSALRRLAAWLTDLVAEPRQPSPEAVASTAIEPSVLRQETTLPLVLGPARAEVRVSAAPNHIEMAHAASEIRSRKVESLETAPAAATLRSPDLSLVVARCKLKAEACRWAILRRRRQEEGASFDQAIKPTDQDLVRRARALPECFIWSLDPYASLPTDSELEDLAAGYENLASAADLGREIRADGQFGLELLEEMYALLAEAQSALRLGLEDKAGRTNDEDQLDAFQFLKTRTYEDRVYVARHMRLDDPADPSGWLDLQQRIVDLRGRFDSRRQRARKRQEQLNKVRFHSRQIERAAATEDRTDDWKKIEDCMERLLDGGMKPSDAEVRELLLPWIDRIPDAFEPAVGLGRVLHEIDRYLASRETAEPDAPRSGQRSAELDEATRLVQGKVVILIGGHERRKSREALKQDLRLAQLRWISSEPHQSISLFEPEIARAETGLVLLAIRWASHSYEGVKEFCKRHGKPFVRLPRGYGSNQVAYEILRQASGQLGP